MTMNDLGVPPPQARAARRLLLSRRLRASVSPVAVWIPIIVIAAALREIRAVPREVATAVPFVLMGVLVAAIILYRRSARARARAQRDRQTYLSGLRAAAPALTPAERDREMKTVEAMKFDLELKQQIRDLLASAPGGMRPLPRLRLKDPDAWFRVGRPLKLRALIAYPAAGLACGAAVVGISSAGVEAIEPLGLVTLFVPAVLTWRDGALADAQPGERAAWSLSATFMFLAWLVAGLLAIAPAPSDPSSPRG